MIIGFQFCLTNDSNATTLKLLLGDFK
jgi:hypothetical protein